MPANNTDTAATLEITIQSREFTVPHRYVAGPCELSPGEAHALQQVYAENIRNNFAQQMKKAAEEGKTLEQSDLDAYVANYDFGIRTSGGVARNPIESEERRLATAAVKLAVTSKGKNWKDLTEEQQEALVNRVVESGKFRAQAEAVVEAKKAARAAASVSGVEVEV